MIKKLEVISFYIYIRISILFGLSKFKIEIFGPAGCKVLINYLFFRRNQTDVNSKRQ